MLVLTTVFAIVFLLVCFWPYIRSYLSKTFLPYIREKIGEKFFQPLAFLLEWLDGIFRGIRRGVKECIRFVKERILTMKSTVTRTNSGSYVDEKITELKTDSGEIAIIKSRQVVDPSSLPVEIQNEIIKQKVDSDGNRKAYLDEDKLVFEKIKKRYEEDRKLVQTADEEKESAEIAELLAMAV